MYTQGLECCALNEIAGLSEHRKPETAIASFCHSFLSYGENTKLKGIGTYYIFSEAQRGKYGTLFAEYIEKNNLGKLLATGDNHNRNYTGRKHFVRVWIWVPDVKSLQTWWTANKKKFPKAGGDYYGDNYDY